MSSGPVPTSSPVANDPPNASTNRPCARKSARRSGISSGARITAFPPPASSPATAFLYVIPRASRSASASASSKLS